MPATKFVTAVDVGQAHDYTAVVVLHTHEVREDPKKLAVTRRHDLVHAERFRDIPYPDQIRKIQQRFEAVKAHAKRQDPNAATPLVVDATGVGKPILDTFREAGLRPQGVIITGGESASSARGLYRVPKRELVTTLQVALQSKRLRIAEDLPLAELLLQEFRGFKVQITAAGHARFGNDVGAWREAEHDDLVLATALGVWLTDRRGSAEHQRRQREFVRSLYR